MAAQRRLRLSYHRWPLKRHIVVVIDDDVAVGESLEALLKSARHDPRVFCSAEEFLESGAIKKADCVITDVCMGGMDGLDLQRRIRVDRPALPVIFITAHHDDRTRRLALENGAAEFLYKPLDGADLLDAIDRAF